MAIEDLMAKERARRYVVDESKLNINKTLFGGEVMAWMDKVGHELSVELTHHTMCTAAADKIRFHKPAYLGETIEVVAKPLDLGPVKIVLELTATADPDGAERRTILTGLYTFVQLDEKGRPHRISYHDPYGCLA
ncbi:MAG: hypothetical protein IKZ67_07385 [Paludibacteraceae bacterium]|nr:hypothetical protein [Paludibacteraceae bacterium]